MAKKTIYRSVIEFEILSEEPIPDGMTLGEIDEECNTGSFSGIHAYKTRNTKLVGKRAAKAVLRQASDPEFFQMDADGNNLDDSSDDIPNTNFGVDGY